jgi:PAS domain S-box-containing protein
MDHNRLLLHSLRRPDFEPTELLDTLVETIPQFIWVAESDGNIIYINRRWANYLAMTLEQVEGDGWMMRVHPHDLLQVQDAWQTAIRTGMPYETEFRMQDGTGETYRWFLARAYPVRDDTGEIIKWFGTSTDINEQKRTEEALRQSQAQVQALLASTIIGIFIAGKGAEIIDANDTFLRMIGYSRDDLQDGRLNCMHMTAPEYIAIAEQSDAQLKCFACLTPYEKEYIGKDGNRVPVVVGGVMTQQDPFQAICFVLDNSARKALEQRKDTFISMASHELRTPLTALKIQMQLLRRRLEKQGHLQVVTAFANVEKPIEQLERLIGELLDVSKMQAGKVEYLQESMDLNMIVEGVAATMQEIYPTHTIIVHPTYPLTILGDKGRLEQVIINLLSNAIKYSPDAKKVEMALRATSETAIISVRDYGVGISQEQRQKIFERFYRVAGPKKGAALGLGIGLYIVDEIVKQHQGTISVESTLGIGSTFYVTLPLKKKASPE